MELGGASSGVHISIEGYEVMKTLITCALLFCTTLAIGQVSLPNPAISLVDNTVYAQSNNVWHYMSGSPLLASMAHGFDSSGVPIHYAVTSAGQVWEFMDTLAPKSYHPNTWVQVPAFGTSIKQMAIGPNSLTYSLQTYAACPSGYYGIFLWNGSAWTRPGTGCVSQLSATPDGTLVGVGATTYLYISSNNSTTWAQVANAGSGWKSVTAYTATFAYATKPNGTIYSVNLSTGAPVLLSGLTNAPVAADASGNAYVVGTDSYVYFLNTAGAWVKVLGSGFANIGMCGPMCIYGIDSSGKAYQFPDHAFQISQQMYGQVGCNGCSQETAYARVHITGSTKHVGGAGYNDNFAGGTQFGFTTPVDTQWDPFDCYDAGGDAVCVASRDLATVADDDHRSDVWSAIAASFPVEVEIAYTKVLRLVNQPPVDCHTNRIGVQICDYPVVQNCTNNPDYNPHFITDTSSWPGWYALGACSRIDTGMTHGPWLCAGTVALETNSITQSPNCSSNP